MNLLIEIQEPLFRYHEFIYLCSAWFRRQFGQAGEIREFKFHCAHGTPEFTHDGESICDFNSQGDRVVKHHIYIDFSGVSFQM